jgi:subtilisin family serine protease
MYLEKRKNRRRRYVILPARGLVSPSLAAGLLTVTDRRIPISEFRSGAEARLRAFAGGLEPAAGGWLTDAGHDLVFAEAGEDEVDIRDSYNEDGPKLAIMNASAERALRAASPGIRIVPLTKYKLVETATPPLDAGGGGGLFLDDFRRRLYGDLGSGALGQGVVVGVLDTGVDRTHPRLQIAVTGGRGMVPEEPEDAWGAPAIGPQSEHGTHVAGLIAANGDPATGPVGVAPDCRLRSYRIFPQRSVAAGADNYSIITGVRAAVDDGCHLINLSFGGSRPKEDGVRDAINYAWDNGVLCMAAAGNSGRKPVVYPAAHPNCVAISAIGRRGCFPNDPIWTKDVVAPFSTEDPEVFVAKFSNIGPSMDFAAPGHALCSTLPNNAYGLLSGTSMAAPVVTGLAAVLLSRNPHLLGMSGNAQRAEAILQMLTSKASVLSFGSPDYEGFGVIRV